MDIPQEALEPSGYQSDDSTISYEEVTQPNPKYYLQAVRVAYGSRSEEYAEFLQLMKDIHNRRTNILVRIRDLFKEHPELVAGFSSFLPAAYEIPVHDQNENSNLKPKNFGDAIDFVSKVKAAYRHDERRYKSFLDLMTRYRKSTDMKPVEVYKQFCNLFPDRQDLIVEFTKFIPDPSRSMTTEAENERKLNRQYIKWRKGGVICLMAFSLVLSLVLAFRMGTGLGNSQSES